MTWPMIFPILLLCCSNVFMTFAWYGQFRYPPMPLWQLVLVSWGIALFEYCLAVPANHFGHRVYSAAQLKTIQEIVTLVVFAGFSVLYLNEFDPLESHRGLRLSCAGGVFLFSQGLRTQSMRPGVVAEAADRF